MKSFLKGLHSVISSRKPLTIVMGNEAADLDSMVSALCYAWYLYKNDPDTNPCPLINIPREDFKLRTEAVFLFEEAGISIQDLIFIDDLELQKLKSEGLLKLILVDHNKLASSQENLKSDILVILDHHSDEKDYPGAALTDIRPVGSTATIVAQAFLKFPYDIDTPLGILLLGTILLDTVNLDPAAGRVTDDDIAVAGKLIQSCGLNQQTLFDKLQYEKFNVAALSSWDLLRKDYKEWQMGEVKCGIAAVLQPIENWAKKDPSLGKECEKYMKKRKLDVLLAMNAFTNPDFNRQLVVCILKDDLKSKTLDFLEGAGLGLDKIDITAVDSSCVYYNQTNLGMSRKKLQPLLKDFFEA